MKLPMIVLREEPAPKPPISRLGTLERISARPARDTRPKLSIDVTETTAGDRRDLRAAGVLLAPPMPVQLIKSLSSAAGAAAGAPPSNWGIAAVGALNSTPTGAGVTVAVLDTGIDAEHPAFKDRGIKLCQRNFTPDVAHDTDGHGTHCAGTIFGRDVSGLRIGVAPGVTRALIAKVIGKDGGSTEQIARAISWAQLEGAHVISMSLGMDFAGFQRQLVEKYNLPERQATSMALAGYRDNVRLFDKISGSTSSGLAIANSAVVVAAAGNESERPRYAVTVAPPAAAEHILSVAALRPSAGGRPLEIAEFSNDGAKLAAPGVDIWSAKRGGGLVPTSGTSMATPHVAGIAALWVEKALATREPFIAAHIIQQLVANALQLPHVPRSDVEYGLVQAP
jgi:subtilisin family serine protease